VQTPHDSAYDGRYPSSHLRPKDFDYSHVRNVLKQISKVDYKSTIVLISTVLPGTIRREFLEYIMPEQFIYNPYLIAMGSVKKDMRNPEMVIIGNSHGSPTSRVSSLVSFYQSICECDRYIFGTWDEAESIKIFYNTFISMKIAFSNMVLDVAEKNGNIDSDVVMKALTESTKRLISPMYMKPGMGDGGPCHPRDNIALSSLAERLDLGYDLFQSIMFSREEQAHNLAMKLTSHRRPVVILGKSYKPNVTLTDGSYSILVADFVELEGSECYFDEEPNYIEGPFTYLIAHRFAFFDYNFASGSIIVDPWGHCPEIPKCQVERYGRR
jgi:UDPglucose 6-dehydrogenase